MNYRKKPVVIEAELFDPAHFDLPFKGRGDPCCLDRSTGQWYIETLEGKHWCTFGDMVIRGVVKGEFYPCKPDIFAVTYESVEAKGEAGEPMLAFVRKHRRASPDRDYLADEVFSDRILALTRPAPADALRVEDLLAWLKSRPGVSWVATIRDVEKAIAALRGEKEGR